MIKSSKKEIMCEVGELKKRKNMKKKRRNTHSVQSNLNFPQSKNVNIGCGGTCEVFLTELQP